MADSRVLATARRIHIRRRVAVLRDSSHFRGFRPAVGGEASRAVHPRELGKRHMRSSLPSGKSATPPARCIHRPQRDTSSAGYRLLVSRASCGASRELSSHRSPALIPHTCAVSPTFRYGAFFFVVFALTDLSSSRLTSYDNGVNLYLFIGGRGARLHFTRRIALTTSLAIASASGGGTELPICLYLSHLEPRNLKSFGNPCNAAASLTVILRIKVGTFTPLMFLPLTAFACSVFSQSVAVGSFMSRTSIIGVLLPPIDAGSV